MSVHDEWAEEALPLLLSTLIQYVDSGIQTPEFSRNGTFLCYAEMRRTRRTIRTAIRATTAWRHARTPIELMCR